MNAIVGDKLTRQVGDVVHIRFERPFEDDLWLPARVVRATRDMIAVQFIDSDTLMALPISAAGRSCK